MIPTLLVLVCLLVAGWAFSVSMKRSRRSAEDAVDDLKKWCACMAQQRRGRARAIEARLLPTFERSSEVIRALEIAFESLWIIEETKNPATLASRLDVAMDNVVRAYKLAPHMFDAGQRDALAALLVETSSDSWARIAITKIDGLMEKARAAKTPATREKRLREAYEFAKEASEREALRTEDRERILLAAPMPRDAAL